MKVINLTPHDINICREDREIILTFPRCQDSLKLVRASVTRKTTGTVNIDGFDIDVNVTEFGNINYVPEKISDTIYIVSEIAASAINQVDSTRDDIFIVDDIIRDNEGKIKGCRALARRVN